MKWEGSLHGRGDTYQCILACQVIPLSVSNYLILFLVVVNVSVGFLPALPCTQLLLLPPPLVLLCLLLPLDCGTVGHCHGWVLR